MQQIEIDPEFSALIPPLSNDERMQLAVNIRRDGCREPLVLWNNILLDGHNRYEICQQAGLGYRTVQVHGVTTREEAADVLNRLVTLTPEIPANIAMAYNLAVRAAAQATINAAKLEQHLLGGEQALAAEPDAALHLYGKPEARPGRKMGHVNRLKPRS